MADDVAERAREIIKRLVSIVGEHGWTCWLEDDIFVALRAQTAATRAEVEKEIADWCEREAQTSIVFHDAAGLFNAAKALRSSAYRPPTTGEGK